MLCVAVQQSYGCMSDAACFAPVIKKNVESSPTVQSTNLGLNDSHESELVHYLRFARSKREEALKAVADAFRGVVESRLLEDEYSLEEVKELLGSIEDVVRADIETELIYSSHTNVLLLKQMFKQAEKWQLNLQTNISELENRCACVRVCVCVCGDHGEKQPLVHADA